MGRRVTTERDSSSAGELTTDDTDGHGWDSASEGKDSPQESAENTKRDSSSAGEGDRMIGDRIILTGLGRDCRCRQDVYVNRLRG